MINKIINIIKKHRKILFIIAVVLAFGLLFKNVFSGSNNITQIKGTEKAVADELQEKIKENTEKYQPKYDWFKAHPYDMTLTAKSAIVINQSNGQVIFSKNEHEKLPPASISKVLTLVTVLENIKTDKLCTVSQKAADTQPNKIVMKAGEKMKVDDLLYGLMMISANDAAEVLAECYDGGRDKFIDKMNEKVKTLGLKDSVFKDPNGLNDTDELSSAYDIGTITRYALMEHPEILKYMGHKGDYSVYPTDHNESHSWYQISHLLSSYPGMEAAKTGYTHIAKNTYIGIAKHNNQEIIIVYFAAETTTSDATALLDYGFSVNPNL